MLAMAALPVASAQAELSVLGVTPLFPQGLLSVSQADRGKISIKQNHLPQKSTCSPHVFLPRPLKTLLGASVNVSYPYWRRQ